MTIYRPRMTAILDVPVEDGSAVAIPMRVSKVTHDSNDHLHADELDIEGEYSDVGVDPRFVKQANVLFYLRDAGDRDELDIASLEPTFVGIAHTVQRKLGASSRTVTLKAQDYTALFLECKPFPYEGVPSMSDTLEDAWKKICDHTGVFNRSTEKLVSTVGGIRDRLVFRGGAFPDQKLARAAAARFSKIGGPIPVKPQSDAWHVWQQCVGMAGLTSFIDGNTCVVTTSKDLFAEDTAAAPVMTWGSNILEIEETAHGKYSAKGVAMVSFNPLTGTTLEAFYPPPGDIRIQHRRPTAKPTKKAVATLVKSEDYDFQSHPGITDPAVLLEIARLAWETRGRQELGGTLQTAEMRTENQKGGEFDLLSLRSGMTFGIKLDPSIELGVFGSLSETDRITYLFERGYSRSAASLIAKNAKTAMRNGLLFKVRKVHTTLESSDNGGSYRMRIDFWNRIEI